MAKEANEKTSPREATETSKQSPNKRPGTSASTSSPINTSSQGRTTAKISGTIEEDKEKRKGIRWSGGSWKGKAAAVAEIARESISITAQTPATESLRSRQDKSPSPSIRLPKSFRTTSKAGSIPASTTRLSVSSGIASDEPLEQVPNTATAQSTETEMIDAPPENDSTTKDDERASNRVVPQDRPTPAAGWRGWWSRPVSTDLTREKAEKVDKDSTEPLNDELNPSKKPEAPLNNDTPEVNSMLSATQSNTGPVLKDTEEALKTQSMAHSPARTSWFGSWGPGPTVSKDTAAVIPQTNSDTAASEPLQLLKDNNTPLDTDKKLMSETSQVGPTQASGSWAFWSREKPKEAYPTDDGQSAKERGELAVANTSSQSDPKPAQIKSGGQNSTADSQNSRKRERTESSLDSAETPANKKSSSIDLIESPAQTKIEQLVKDGSSFGEKIDLSKQSAPKSKGLSKRPINLVLPNFRGTYHLAETPSYLQQLIHLIGRKPSAEIRHLCLSPAVPKIRKAIAIGVHGFFPAPLIQKVIGQPTGTSLRFANGAAAAIQKWTTEHGYSCEIEKVALEGEGMIGERVDTLWKLLLNWIDQIRKADFILIACHSQGVPVTIMLVAKLINFGCLSNTVRVGVCSMAGINLGPFPTYAGQSRLFGNTANELFDFSRPGSSVSKAYASALELCLAKHVRVLYVGSIDDQLVSLESAIFSNISHPYIYRAVFVDGRIHAPDFLTHLVGFALKLRNLGVQDHGLVRELSSPLAGSLYSGEGHSRIYEESSVYDLAMEYTIETADLLGSATIETKPYEVPNAANTNPYFLPWALRGLLEEEFVKEQLKEETSQLLRQFESWRPSSKVLKDVKFRLEAVKSKL